MKQEKDSLLEISANGGEHLTTDMSTHHDDPSQSVRTLGGITISSAVDQRMLDSQTELANHSKPEENGRSSNVAPAKPCDADKNHHDQDKENKVEGPPSGSKEKNIDFATVIDQNQLMAIQDVMVDMSNEDRQKFMDQINSHVNSDNRMDPDVFYRHGGDANSFIKETDQRERLENPLGRAQIPLGPQAEEDAGQFEEIFK